MYYIAFDSDEILLLITQVRKELIEHAADCRRSVARSLNAKYVPGEFILVRILSFVGKAVFAIQCEFPLHSLHC